VRRRKPVFATILFTVGGAIGATAQRAAPVPPPPQEETVAVDPIRCWWRTSAGAVRIGETFDLALTCAVLENEAVRVVPDESRLGPSVVTLAPFEVVDGTHPADIRSGQRRFFQYHYNARIINRDVIGTDVNMPVFEIHYRVDSRISGNAALEGRDLTYLLPPQQIRVLSMVPDAAADIRDTPGSEVANFSEIEALTFRASLLRVVAITLMAVGALMAVAAVVRLLLRGRRRVPIHEQRVSELAVLRTASRQLAAAVRESEAQGWNEASADRALSAVRVAAAIALGRRVSQRAETAAGGDSVAGEGRLVVRRGRRPVVLSSSVTREDVNRTLVRLPPSAAPAIRQTLEELQAAFTAFGQMLYGRPAAEPMPRSGLDEAARGAAAAVQRLSARLRSPAEYFRRWTTRAAQPEGLA
jgi:hypothetical protein